MPNDRPALEKWGASQGRTIANRHLVVLGVLAALVVGRLWLENRALQRQLEQVRAEQAEAADRDRELARSVASKHQELQGAQSELDAVRWRMSAVELQLDGVDRLSREVRNELGLPDGHGTWGDTEPLETPQGGPGADFALGDRAELAQRRLAFGLRELEFLVALARAPAAPVGQPSPQLEVSASPAGWPVRGGVTSDYGWRIFRGRPEYHTGVDISVADGTPVRASAAGTVVGSGWQPSYGWVVLVQNPGGYHTLYAHLSERRAKNGDTVAAGDIVGLSGSSGRSTGPHLHYEIWKDGRLQNPAVFMSPPGGGDGRD